MIAATAVSIVPWPLNMTTGTCGCSRFSLLQDLHAVERLPSSQMSSRTRPGGRLRDLAQRLVAARGTARPIALVLENAADDLADCRLVIDNQYVLAHPSGPAGSLDDRHIGDAVRESPADLAPRARGLSAREDQPHESAAGWAGQQFHRAAMFLHDLPDDGKP